MTCADVSQTQLGLVSLSYCNLISLIFMVHVGFCDLTRKSHKQPTIISMYVFDGNIYVVP